MKNIQFGMSYLLNNAQQKYTRDSISVNPIIHMYSFILNSFAFAASFYFFIFLRLRPFYCRASSQTFRHIIKTNSILLREINSILYGKICACVCVFVRLGAMENVICPTNCNEKGNIYKAFCLAPPHEMLMPLFVFG